MYNSIINYFTYICFPISIMSSSITEEILKCIQKDIAYYLSETNSSWNFKYFKENILNNLLKNKLLYLFKNQKRKYYENNFVSFFIENINYIILNKIINSNYKFNSFNILINANIRDFDKKLFNNYKDKLFTFDNYKVHYQTSDINQIDNINDRLSNDIFKIIQNLDIYDIGNELIKFYYEEIKKLNALKIKPIF